jgi:caa(3)-type oxidase subunit IV
MSEIHSPAHYVKMWAILVGLLIVSLVGPLFGITALTLVTAFGIALVKASLVAAHFMHLNVEKRYIRYMLYTMVLIVALLFAGTAPDILKPAGLRWQNRAVIEHIEQPMFRE